MGRLIVSAMIAGLMAAGTAFLARAADATTLSDISGLAWAIIGVGAAMVMLKDIKTYLAPRPPTVPTRRG